MKKITFLKKKVFSLLLLSISCFSIGQTLDQSHAPDSYGGGGFNSNQTQNVGQSFIAGLSGDLSQINIRIGNFGSNFIAGDFQLRIFSGNGYSGSVLNTTVFTISLPPVTDSFEELIIPLSSLVPVTSGNPYTIDVRGITGAVTILGTSPNYVDGGFYTNNGNNGLYNYYDLWFKTFVNLSQNASALNFDGNNNIVTFNNTLGNFGTGDFSIEFQIKTSLQNYYVFSKRGVCNNDNFLSINIGNGKIGMETANINIAGSGASLAGNTFISDNVWHKVSFTRNAGVLTSYIDGVQDAQFSPSTPQSINVDLNNNYVLQLGGIAPCTPYIGYQVLRGSIDEVRIWNRALPQAEIINNMNCELAPGQTGLLAYYKFNQGVSNVDNTAITTLTDSSGNGNNGTLSNFTLSGLTSNWVDDSLIVSGNNCSTYLSTDSFVNNDFKYYPNPTSDILTVSYSKQISEVEVLNLLGQTVLTQKGSDLEMQLDLSRLTTGTYLVKVASEGQSKTLRIIKK